MVNFLKLIRFNNYIKNVVIFFAVIFIKNITANQLFFLFITFIAFCLVSSSIYIINDIIDFENDIKHPIKSKRIIASKKISFKNAFLIAILLLLFGLILTSSINKILLLFLAVYFLLNLLYSFFLKKIFILNSILIALFFVIRIYAGFLTLNIEPNTFFIFLIFFNSLFFAFLKRKQDNYFIKNNSFKTKATNIFTITSLFLTLFINLFFALKFNSIIVYSFVFFYVIFLLSIYITSLKNKSYTIDIITKRKFDLVLLIILLSHIAIYILKIIKI